MLSISGAVTIIVYLIVAGLVFWLLWWLVNFCNPPEPFKMIANVVLAIVAVLVVIGVLLSLVGGQPIFRADVEKPKLKKPRSESMDPTTKMLLDTATMN